MNSIAQNLIVLLLVGGCFAYVGWQAVQAFRGRKSKLGSCCAKGCDAGAMKPETASSTPPEQFIPLAALTRRVGKH